MNFTQGVLLMCLAGLLASCSSTGMVTERYDSRTGEYERRVYSKHYNAAEWLQEGKLGLELWIDHEKKAMPVIQQTQQALGLLGPSDAEAMGLVTLYFVNLDSSGKSLHVSSIKSTWKGANGPMELPVEIKLEPRSHTALVLGAVPINNYGISAEVEIGFSVDGVPLARKLTAKRLTDVEMAQYSGRSGKPPYPWFAAPYYPFNPPLAQRY